MPLCFVRLGTTENASLLTEEITEAGTSLLNGDDIKQLPPQDHDVHLEHTLPGEHLCNGKFMYISISSHNHSWLKEIKFIFLTRAESSK